MDEGFKVKNAVGLATECFTEKEIDLLKSVLENKFGLLITKNLRKTSGNRQSFRLFISAKSKKKLLSLVLPYFIPEMLYKLNI
jgi:LAGLIDADG DNA endonuclease family